MKTYKLKCCEGVHPRILVSEDFVVKHNFTLNRTQDEIYTRIKEDNGFKFCFEVLINYLNMEHLKEFLKKVEQDKEPHHEVITDIFETVQDMLDYLIFGYSKALDKRGLSASSCTARYRQKTHRD